MPRSNYFKIKSKINDIIALIYILYIFFYPNKRVQFTECCKIF